MARATVKDGFQTDQRYMNTNVLDTLLCPTCGSTSLSSRTLEGSAADIREGIVWCENRDWFPIEQRVLEFVPQELQYREDRIDFQKKHATELNELGLLDGRGAATRARASEEVDLIHVQQRHFDWYAENERQAYNAYAAMPFWRVVDERTFAAWNAKIQKACRTGSDAKRLLDVGCAQGRSALMVAQPGVHVIGFDISKSMVRQAYQNFRDASSGDGWNDFIVADGCRFPFRSGVFDYALVYGVLHHLPDPGAACREIVRVLKSGGTYFGSENNRTIFRSVFDLLQRFVPAWHEEAGTQPLIGSRDLDRWFSGTGLTIKTSATVFIPPHVVNALGINAGGFLLDAGDAMLRAIPFLKDQGGLILVQGTKA